MILSVHQPQYLPWLGYFDKIAQSDTFVFLNCVQYKHREFQNRNKIRTADGWLWLTVPVETKDKHEQLISEVKIDNSLRWQEKHWRAIRTSYGKARFFKEYSEYFEYLYCRKKWDFLNQLNTEMTRHFLEIFEIKTPFCFESDVCVGQKSTERIIDLCKALKADIYLSGSGGKDYLDEKRFIEENITLKYQQFKHPVYQQCFLKNEADFIPCMCALDLLFNEGPNSIKIFKK
jgi:hypothetical protein